MKMKKLTITGLVLAIIAVGVFLACAQAPKKAKSGPKYMKIKISTETGDVVEKVDENNNPATQLTPAELQQLYNTQNPRHIGTILHTHSSPGCAYLVIFGWAYRICDFPTPP
jgi:hypothetical protein